MIIGSKIYHKKSCTNSLDWAKSEIDSAQDGAVFLCDHHETTRGRQDRIWQSDEEGQLLLTFVLKNNDELHYPSFDYEKNLMSLCMTISLGFLYPIKQFGVGLKWPNDFVVNNKKVGGMLLEPVWHGNRLTGIVVGFGLNVNNIFEKNNKLFSIATSLKKIKGQT